ncbi:MAG: sugar phosphate nucleotidyltransferase [Lachnospiraceae bacterium]|nr:sugar phosphate nucleotidyltransferase [Lachnospiraceae bacterium]
MKCIILSGGKGDRLWPLSRGNYPKQFIQLRGNHSLFQETVARNMPFCDEFLIVTNKEYRDIVENQMQAFQETTYRLALEETGRKTAAAILLSCLEFPLSEKLFVVAADHLIGSEGYKDAVMTAMEYASNGQLVTFGMPIEKPDTRFGYIRYQNENVVAFMEKPDMNQAKAYAESSEYLVNSGMFVFQNGVFLNEVRKYAPDLLKACEQVYGKRKLFSNGCFFSKEQLEKIAALPVEKAVFEYTNAAKVIRGQFTWQDVGSLEDLEQEGLTLDTNGLQIVKSCKDTMVLNQCEDRVVVANGLENTVVVNTRDAVYVGRKGVSEDMKDILKENPALQSFFGQGRVNYRRWGYYETLSEAAGYRVNRLVMHPGASTLSHSHAGRAEHWTVVQGRVRVLSKGMMTELMVGESAMAAAGEEHQLLNPGKEQLILIEVATGANVRETAVVAQLGSAVTEADMGVEIDPFVRLKPAFKDYLWGGTKLREVYGKRCEYDQIAESWELSAHPAGQSIVTTGSHRGLTFGAYLEAIGQKNWGWKCQSLANFPILIKFIDAKQALSVQVHPDDEYALTRENEYGKNEMWYIVDCEEGAGIYCGFNRDVTREEVQAKVQDNTIQEILNWIPVEKGKVYFIPAGTVHAICKGCLICEIQQSSNVTYRLYDYNRKDKFGNTRELHLEKALDVLQYGKYLESPRNVVEADVVRTEAESQQGLLLSSCKYFESRLFRIADRMELEIGEESFASLIFVTGRGIVSGEQTSITYWPGDSVFVPSGRKTITIEGPCELIVTRV